MLGIFRTPNHMEDLALFTRHVAGAMNARAPLPDLLRAYTMDCENGALSHAVTQIADRAESGVELSEALEHYPKLFPSAYRRLVHMGEQGRSLGGVMAQLAAHLEEGLKVFEYFRRAAIYPLFVIVLIFLQICFVTITIMPKFQAIYEELGSQLPGPLGSPDAMRNLFIVFGLMALVPIGFLVASAMGLKIRGAGYGRLALSFPLVGPVLRRAETARFANNLALLLDNNIPMAEALALLADSSENTYVRAAIQDLQQRYESGEKLGDLIATQPLFPASMAAMIGSAEDRGGLVDTLRALGQFHAERTSHGLTVLREVFEPILLLLVGLLVGLILLAAYLPLFQIPRMMG